MRSGLPAYCFLIRLPRTQSGTTATPSFFIETNRIPKDLQTAPTLKLLILTRDNIKHREYLTITLLSPIKNPPGTTWVPQTSMTPSKTQFSLLAITDPMALAESWTIHFRQDTTIYPEQMDIRNVDSSNSTPKKRKWNISWGRSTLRDPITEQADLPDPIPTIEPIIPLQIITIVISDEMVGLDKIFSNPVTYEIYLRRSLNIVNFFYEHTPNPLLGDIAVHYKHNQLFFTRIYSVKHRKIYRKICNSKEWLNIFPPSNEFHILVHNVLNTK